MQCSAHNQAGEPCRRLAIRGATVCYTHGGAAPQVKRKAAETLEAARQEFLRLVEPAIGVLEEIILHGETDGHRLRAVRDVLDRAGLQATHKSESRISLSQTTDLDNEISDLISQIRAKETLERAESERTKGTSES